MFFVEFIEALSKYLWNLPSQVAEMILRPKSFEGWIFTIVLIVFWLSCGIANLIEMMVSFHH